MLKIQSFVFNPFSENTFIIWDSESSEAAIIDPGCNDDNEREEVDNFLHANSLRLKYIINTHCHIDHIFGNSYIKEKYNAIFLAPEMDVPLMDLMIGVAKVYAVELTPSPKPDQTIVDEQKFVLGKTEGRFLFTPGHTQGEVCLYFERDKVCFTGDVLFNKSIGRTDLPGGSYETIIASIENKLFTLPENVVIYPGHGAPSTIGEEKNENPFFH